jgi:hypothetical protein
MPTCKSPQSNSLPTAWLSVPPVGTLVTNYLISRGQALVGVACGVLGVGIAVKLACHCHIVGYLYNIKELSLAKLAFLFHARLSRERKFSLSTFLVYRFRWMGWSGFLQPMCYSFCSYVPHPCCLYIAFENLQEAMGWSHHNYTPFSS